MTPQWESVAREEIGRALYRMDRLPRQVRLSGSAGAALRYVYRITRTGIDPYTKALIGPMTVLQASIDRDAAYLYFNSTTDQARGREAATTYVAGTRM